MPWQASSESLRQMNEEICLLEIMSDQWTNFGLRLFINRVNNLMKSLFTNADVGRCFYPSYTTQRCVTDYIFWPHYAPASFSAVICAINLAECLCCLPLTCTPSTNTFWLILIPDWIESTDHMKPLSPVAYCWSFAKLNVLQMDVISTHLYFCFHGELKDPWVWVNLLSLQIYMPPSLVAFLHFFYVSLFVLVVFFYSVKA